MSHEEKAGAFNGGSVGGGSLTRNESHPASATAAAIPTRSAAPLLNRIAMLR